MYGFVPRFSLVEEANVPTWYSSAALLACAALLAAVARTEREAGSRFVLHWKVLALLFLGLSVDEAAALHELLIEPVRGALGAGGLFYFAWVVPALAALAVLGLAYLRFLAHLPPQTRRLFLAAAATFVGGAVGAEMAGGAWVESRGFHNAGSALLWTVEESLEMVGVVVFVYALLRHLELRGGAVTIWVLSTAEGETSAASGEAAYARERALQVLHTPQNEGTLHGLPVRLGDAGALMQPFARLRG
ncbi:MAG: hypothetical protein AB1941_22425 [Gemmatimonadota bacterium]